MSDTQSAGGDQGRPPTAEEFRVAGERAMLKLCGERGYEGTTVAAVVEHTRSSLGRFYRTWSSKQACYAAAHAAAAERLRVRLLAACAGATDWPAGMKRALVELAAFTAEDPALAAGMITEVQVANGAALLERDLMISELSVAVDRARADATMLRAEPPPATATFVVEAIEAATVRCLAEGRPLREELPGLLHLAVSSYFGAAAASRAVRTLRAELEG